MTIQLTGVSRSGSPLLSLSQGSAQNFTWSPYGNSPARAGQSALLPGFNGERADPLTGVTHLGNGYRAYNPTLMRFTCPDSHSPFGNGGVNPYAYCSGDPINRTDPSGHGPALWTVLAGEISAADAATYTLVTAAMVAQRNARKIAIGTGIASLAVSLQVASNKTQESNPQASRNLQWAALGLGVAVNAAFIGLGTYKVVRKIMQMVSQPARLVTMPGAAAAEVVPEAPPRGRPVEGEVGDGFLFDHDESTTSGYIPGGMPNGEDLIIAHGSEDGMTIGIDGHDLNAMGAYFFFKEHGIDLRLSNRPLHIASCYLASAFNRADGFANLFAALLERPVITYGRGGIIGLEGGAAEATQARGQVTIYEPRFSWLPIPLSIFMRNAHSRVHSPDDFYRLEGIPRIPGGIFQ